MPTSKPDPKSLLKTLLDAATLPAVTLVSAPDRTRRERTLDLIVNRAIELSGTKRSQLQSLLSKFSAQELKGANYNKFEQACASLSLFSKLQLIVVNDCDELNAEQTDNLLKLLPNIAAPTCLVLVSNPLPSNSRLARNVRERGTALEFAEITGADLRRWVSRECSRHGIKDVAAEVVDDLIGIGEGKIDQIAPCIEQLALYLDGAPATQRELARLFVERVPPNQFALSELIANNSLVKAEALTRELVAEGKHPLMLTGLLARTFHNYLKVSALREAGGTPNEIRQRLKLAPWIFQKHLDSAKRYSWKRARHALRSLVRGDSKLKNRSVGPDAVLYELIHELAPR